MMKFLQSTICVSAFSCCFIVAINSALAQTPESRLVFDPPLEANFRQTSGTVGRGLLVSIDPLNVRIRLPNGTDKDVPLKVIQYLRTIDRQFSYRAKDDIRALIAEGSQIEGTLLEAAVIDSSVGSDPEGPATNGGFGTAKPNDSSSGMANGGFGSAKPTETPANGGFGTAKPKTGDPKGTIITCANCNKEVHSSADYGQVCPHCGIEWSVHNPATAAAGQSTNASSNSGQSSTNTASGVRSTSPMHVTPQSAPPSSNLPPATPGQAQELTLANMPIWMKAGLFIAFAAGGYYMFFYRA